MEVVHFIGGRARLRLSRDAVESIHVATAFLSSVPGVTAVRANRACRSVVVRFDPARTSVDTLVTALAPRLEPTTNRSSSTADICGHLVRVIAPLVLRSLAPPGVQFVEDVLAAFSIAREAFRELRVRPWRTVLLRAVARLVWECSFVHVLLPAQLGLLLRLARKVFSLHSLAVRLRLPPVHHASRPLAYAA